MTPFLATVMFLPLPADPVAIEEILTSTLDFDTKNTAQGQVHRGLWYISRSHQIKIGGKLYATIVPTHILGKYYGDLLRPVEGLVFNRDSSLWPNIDEILYTTYRACEFDAPDPREWHCFAQYSPFSTPSLEPTRYIFIPNEYLTDPEVVAWRLSL